MLSTYARTPLEARRRVRTVLAAGERILGIAPVALRVKFVVGGL